MTTYKTREQWLQAAAVKLRRLLSDRAGLECPEVRIGVGWPSSGARSNVGGQCWARRVSADEIAEITIRVTITDAVTVLAVQLHEMIHAALDCEHKHGGPFKAAHTALGFTGSAKGCTPGDDLRADLAAIAERLGAYPGAEFKAGVSSGPAKQTTRMIKAECEACGFTFRAARTWLEAAESLTCPDASCGGSVEVAA